MLMYCYEIIFSQRSEYVCTQHLFLLPVFHDDQLKESLLIGKKISLIKIFLPLSLFCTWIIFLFSCVCQHTLMCQINSQVCFVSQCLLYFSVPLAAGLFNREVYIEALKRRRRFFNQPSLRNCPVQ